LSVKDDLDSKTGVSRRARSANGEARAQIKSKKSEREKGFTGEDRDEIWLGNGKRHNETFKLQTNRVLRYVDHVILWLAISAIGPVQRCQRH
jgi:hypothetical protein